MWSSHSPDVLNGEGVVRDKAKAGQLYPVASIVEEGMMRANGRVAWNQLRRLSTVAQTAFLLGLLTCVPNESVAGSSDEGRVKTARQSQNARTVGVPKSEAPSATPTASPVEQRDRGQSTDQTPAIKREQLAEELLMVMNVKSLFSAVVDTQIEQAPSMRPYRDILLEFDMKLWTETVMPKIVALYAESYTESEFEALIAFLRTPVGQKMNALAPELMRHVGVITQEAMKAHTAELFQMIRKRKDELEKVHTEP